MVHVNGATGHGRARGGTRDARTATNYRTSAAKKRLSIWLGYTA